MARVLFRVSYSIPDGKRGDYLAFVNAVRSYYSTQDIGYAVFESKGRHNHFQEVYTYPSADVYDQSDDPASVEEIASAIEGIYSLAKDVTYDVAFEID
jgi:hypothetical protein